jgi:DMSO/TMAO reductase YedYZ heme-binding membrane subunit
MIGQLDPQFWWYVARSGGMVAWGVVTASIVWGLTLSTKLVRRRGAPAWLLDLHRYLGLLAVVFTAVHLLGLWADSFVSFGPSELFVPMASAWRPGAVAWGIAGMYLLVAIEVSSLLMRRLPRRVWRAIHLTSIPLFVTATVHGFQSGADRANLLVEWLALTGCTLVVFLVVFRLLVPRRSSPRVRAATPAPDSAEAVAA